VTTDNEAVSGALAGCGSQRKAPQLESRLSWHTTAVVVVVGAGPAVVVVVAGGFVAVVVGAGRMVVGEVALGRDVVVVESSSVLSVVGS
jgi:hypothetical protein